MGGAQSSPGCPKCPGIEMCPKCTKCAECPKPPPPPPSILVGAATYKLASENFTDGGGPSMFMVFVFLFVVLVFIAYYKRDSLMAAKSSTDDASVSATLMQNESSV